MVCSSSSGTQPRDLQMLGELAVRHLGPERKQEIAEAPGGAAGAGGAVARIGRAPGGVGDVIVRRADRDGVEDRIVVGEVVRIDMAGMQKSEMRGVDVAFERLQIIAMALDEEHADLVVGNAQDLEARQRRRFGARSHIDPHHAGAFDHAVRLGPTLCLKSWCGGTFGMSMQRPVTSNFQP